ncbi:MAG: peptide ABC transporter substrate-binding protein [Betaproteobacteria bacterium HGW-Betaproteobacteria-11]|nr:MAG: peptide ABC transporter substrate-binding protein [Betaproteobacteria bacterium HGW-Betaproteobacteria-11]
MPFSLRLKPALACAFLLAGCDAALNDPYPAAERNVNILHSAFTDRPKHLDPVQSYSEDEIVFTAQIYEPPLQYHYLKRPYTLEPATATRVPQPVYLDAEKRVLPANVNPERIAFTDYVISIKPGILYQPHPAFARDAAGGYVYHQLAPGQLARIETLADFPLQGSRELTAEDYVYGLKRLAHPRLHSPILGLMSEYIVGLDDFAGRLKKSALAERRDEWLDLRQYPLAGAEVIDRYRYRIRIKGKYPQFLYWLAMPFFAPMPWEADKFYSQPGMAQKNLTLDWYPVGSGPYMLTENDPNSRMILQRNPNFHGERYPCAGEVEDAKAGLLDDCGKPLPFIDKIVFTREKEQIPYWNKFLQGYYDASGISSDTFDQAVQTGSGGEATLTEAMRGQGITLSTSVATSTFYMGFNWLDPLVGGGNPATAERARKLRQAIGIAIDQEEFISIFQNGRGVAAQGPIPPGIFGFREGEPGINRLMYDWVDGQPRRKPVVEARRLLAEAGWPNGRDAQTGEPLIIYLDTTATGVGAKSRIDWLAKQFAKIDVQLVVRNTDYNRFQEKVRKGAAQLFYFGWNADYPDPENFLFLFYGKQAAVGQGGSNAANYSNPEYDRLFEQMQTMENGPQRQALIDRMIVILRQDAPWVWGFHPKDYSLQHAWLKNSKPSKVGHNTLKYQRVDAALRAARRTEWNRPVFWPLGLLLLTGVIMVWPAWRSYRQRERMTAR